MTLPLDQATQAGNSFLSGTIVGRRRIELPNTVGDCKQATQWVDHDFRLHPGDYIDLTIVSRQGIAPGGNNGLSFFLTQTGTSNTQSWSLLMMQKDPAQDYLYSETWRFLVDAKEIGEANEIGDGGPVMPPYGKDPWQRLYNSGLIGGTYKLVSTNNLVATVSATLTFTLHETLPAFCSAQGIQ